MKPALSKGDPFRQTFWAVAGFQPSLQASFALGLLPAKMKTASPLSQACWLEWEVYVLCALN